MCRMSYKSGNKCHLSGQAYNSHISLAEVVAKLAALVGFR